MLSGILKCWRNISGFTEQERRSTTNSVYILVCCNEMAAHVSYSIFLFHPVLVAIFCCVETSHSKWSQDTSMVCINPIILYSNSKKRKERGGKGHLSSRWSPEGRKKCHRSKKFQIKFLHPFSLQSPPSRLHPEPSIYRGSQKSGP